MGNLPSALVTDWALERTGEIGGAFKSAVAATNAGSNTARTFTDTNASWTVDQWVGYQIRISVGTCAGQRRRIIGNNTNTLTVQRPFDATPSQTDTYAIFGDTDKIYMTGNGYASMLQYSVENDSWAMGNAFDWGVARIGSVQLKASSALMGAQEPIGIASIVYSAVGMLTAPVTTAGTGFVRADIGATVTIATVTTGSAVITGITDAGGLASVEIMNAGTAGTAGSQLVSGGTGSGAYCTITIGKVGLVTTAINHNLKTSDPILMAGDTSAGNYWNGNFTVLGISSQTVFSVAANASATINSSYTALSATVLVDASQNWTASEHIGKILMEYQTPTAPGLYTLQATCTAAKITANTSNSLTFTTGTITTPVNSVSRYVIFDPAIMGREEQYKIPTQKGEGYATGGGATSLTDSTKSWLLNQWVGYKVRIVCGTGIANGETAITASNSTSITVASWSSATPDTTSKYIIMDSFGTNTTGGSTTVITDTAKNWVVNGLAGKRVKITGGVNAGLEVSIASNTATALTVSAITSDTTDMTYCIVSPAVKASSITLQWMYNTSKQQKGRYMISPRGNSPYWDIFDICRGTWDFQTFLTPQTEILVPGTMYAYDGGDRLYFTIGATGKVQCLDLSNGVISGSGMTPYAQGAALVGNKMEIVSTADGLDYIYIMRHTGAEMWRALAFWSGW